MKLSMNDVFDFIDYRMDLEKYLDLVNIKKIREIVDSYTDKTVTEEFEDVDYLREYVGNEIYILLVEQKDRIRDLTNFGV